MFNPSNDRDSCFPGLSGEARRSVDVFADNSSGAQLTAAAIAAAHFRVMHAEAYKGFSPDLDFPRSAATDYRLERARQCGAMLCGGRPEHVGFTSSFSTVLELVSYHFQETVLEPGDSVVITEADHEANRTPWIRLQQLGVKIIDVSCDACGSIDPEVFSAAMQKGPKVVALNMISNATGTIQPYASLVRQAKNAGAFVVLDAVQGPPHGFTDAMKVGADLAAFSACKMFSPTLGWWCMSEALAKALSYTPAVGSNSRLECGRQSFANIDGFAATCHYLIAQGRMHEDTYHGRGDCLDDTAALARFMQWVVKYERKLSTHFLENISGISGIRLLGTEDARSRVPIFALEIPQKCWDSVRQKCLEAKIEARIGKFRCPTLMDRIGSMPDKNAFRASFVFYNTIHDIDRVCEVLNDLA